MKSSISIVMAYYNRLDQLRLTLKTIQKFNTRYNIEVVIIDDGSEPNQKADLLLDQFDLKFIYEYYEREDRTWINPCVPFNVGFKKATGEVIIIQNPECFHVGDVIGYTLKNVGNNYLVFSCKNVNYGWHQQLLQRFDDSTFFNQSVMKLKDSTGQWYCHHKYNPTGYHFTSAIAKRNLDELGGFDERYAGGYSFDDNEFLARVSRSPFDVIMVPPDECFVVHQWHISTLPKKGNKDQGWKDNYHLFHETTMKEITWKANQ